MKVTNEQVLDQMKEKVNVEHEHHAGGLVFELAQGAVAVEIWLSEEAGQ